MSGIVDGSKLANANKGFRAVFFDNLGHGRSQLLLDLMAFQVTSTNASEVYRWLGAVPAMTEWTEDRRIQKLRADGYELVNQDWSNGLEVPLNDIRDDNLGIVTPRIQGLAASYGRHRLKLLRDLLNNGFTKTCYDGQFFFDTDHKDGDGPTQDNLQTGTLTTANYEAAVQKLEELKDEESEFLDLSITHLIVGADNRAAGAKILNAEFTGGGDTNIHYKEAELLVIPGITATNWMVADLSVPGMKPFTYQLRERVTTSSMDSPDSPNVFHRKAALFGAECSDTAGYAFWQTMVGSTG